MAFQHQADARFFAILLPSPVFLIQCNSGLISQSATNAEGHSDLQSHTKAVGRKM